MFLCIAPSFLQILLITSVNKTSKLNLFYWSRPAKENSGQSRILASTLWILDLSVELGFWIPVVLGFRICLLKFRILKPRIPDSNFFPDSGFRIPQAKIFQIPEGTEKRATKTCNLFCNIAAKRVEKECCAFYHPHSNLLATNQAVASCVNTDF